MEHRKKPLINKDGEVRELTREDFAKFKPVSSKTLNDFKKANENLEQKQANATASKKNKDTEQAFDLNM